MVPTSRHYTSISKLMSFSLLFLYSVKTIPSIFVSCCWIDTITRLADYSHASTLTVCKKFHGNHTNYCFRHKFGIKWWTNTASVDKNTQKQPTTTSVLLGNTMPTFRY